MDKGPFRVQRPENAKRQSERSTVQQSDIPSAKAPAPGGHTMSPSRSHPVKDQKKKPLKLILAVVLAAALVFALWYGVIGRSSTLASTIDNKKYQAVFFSNGQVYFGKLNVHNKDYLKLTNIFYLQSQDSTDQTDELQAGATQEGELQLIKLGNEVHGPEDQMMINRDQILFYENLKSDSKVATSIKDYQSKN